MHIRLNIKRKFLEFLTERETMIKIMQVEDIQQLQKINAQKYFYTISKIFSILLRDFFGKLIIKINF